jgi:hypothetical protein
MAMAMAAGAAMGVAVVVAAQRWQRSNVEAVQQWWWTEAIVEYDTIELYCTLFLSNKLIYYVAFYVGPIQTGFLMSFQNSYGGTGIVIPVKKVPQEQKKQESGGFLQELPT